MFREVLNLKYGIVAFPSKNLQDLANNYRKRYDPHYAQIAPHITLKDAFEADESAVQNIIAQLTETAANFAPLNIHASRISSFYPTTNAIYFRIEPTEQLANIQKAIQDSIAFGEQKHVFVPHITIAQKLTASEHDDILGQLRMEGIDVQEKIQQIHLVQEQDGKWEVVESFRLNGAE